MKNITLALAIALGFCATETVAQAVTQPRRSLLVGRNRSASAPAAEEVKTASQEPPEERALREKKEAEEKAERELWATWPKDVRPWDTNIVKKCEEDFRVVFYGEDNDGWVIGGGKCLIDWEDDRVDEMKKFDSKGTLSGKMQEFQRVYLDDKLCGASDDRDSKEMG